ncbi:MAG: hypothetical protein AB7N76_24725 [Planctomycetota bacterium]
MISLVQSRSLSHTLQARARQTADRLASCPFYSRLLAGEVDRDEYAAWLVQMHKYVRYSERLIQQVAEVTSAEGSEEERELHAYAVREAREEAHHDDLILVDLSRLWGISRTEARGRIEETPTAPAVLTYSRLRDVFMTRHAKAAVGAAVALETISALHADAIRAGLLANSRIEGIQRATTFLKAHRAEVEQDHCESAAERIERLEDPHLRSAVFTLGTLVLNMYEGIAFFLAETHPAGRAQ